MSAHGITLTGYCARWASGLVVEPLGTWDSTGQEQLSIERVSDEWHGVITATFWGPGAETGTDMLMDGGTCIVPPEALSAPGNGTVTLRCTNAQGRRISVDLAYHSAGHAQVPGSPSEPTPDLWQQYVEQVAADADRAEQSSKDAAGSADAAAKSAEAAAESAKQAAQATADIGDAKDAALEAIQQAQDTGVQAVQRAHQAALDDIATDRQQALTDIETEGEKQMSAITSNGAAALEAIGRVEQTAIGQVQQAGQAQQTAIEQAGQSWQQQIAAAGTAELGRWAPAIWDTAPLAAAHDIYAAEGAPLRVAQQGETQQQTTTGAQLFDISAAEPASTSQAFGLIIDFDGDFVYASGTSRSGMRQFSIRIIKIPELFPEGVKIQWFDVTQRKGSLHSLKAPTSEADPYIVATLIADDDMAVDMSFKVMVSAQAAEKWEPYTGGAPSPSPDYPQEIAGIDSPVTAQTSDGQTTTSISMDIGSPLYGDSSVADTVANDVPSGCDKAIVLDGSEDWTVTSTGAMQYNINIMYNEMTVYAISSRRYLWNYIDANAQNRFALATNALFLVDSAATTLNAFKAQLAAWAAAANPLKIWYRSTAYTEAADLHIDKTTRRWKMVELDGTENWNKLSEVDNGYQMPLTGGVDNLLCTHLIHNTTTADGTIYLNSSELLRVYGPWNTVSDLTTWLAAQKSAGTPVRVLYKLATPEEYASDPHTLPALGSLPETVKATGQSTVSYSADTKHYIDNKLQAIAAQQLNLIIGGST